jgi:hypothetical protein
LGATVVRVGQRIDARSVAIDLTVRTLQLAHPTFTRLVLAANNASFTTLTRLRRAAILIMTQRIDTGVIAKNLGTRAGAPFNLGVPA